MPGGAHFGQLDLVGPDEASALEVDQVPRPEVPRQQHLPSAPFERTKGFRAHGEASAVVIEIGYLMGVSKAFLPIEIDDQSRDGRVPDGTHALSSQAGDNVRQPANVLFIWPRDRGTEQAREVKSTAIVSAEPGRSRGLAALTAVVHCPAAICPTDRRPRTPANRYRT